VGGLVVDQVTRPDDVQPEGVGAGDDFAGVGIRVVPGLVVSLPGGGQEQAESPLPAAPRAATIDPLPRNHPYACQEPIAMNLNYESIAKRVDHSLLGPTLTDAELEAGCRLAATYDVASVCIKPYAVPLAAKILGGSGVFVGTTIGFPHGGQTTAAKVFESRRAIEDGATELDMVINIGQALAGRWDAVRDDIAAVTEVAHQGRGLVKVIFENCYLDDDQKTRLCAICGEEGVDYVKTSTGYGSGGATRDDLILMRRSSPSHVKLKAAGGVRDLKTAIEFVELGCERLGLSKTSEILDALCDRIGQPRRGATIGVVSRGTGRESNDAY